jgi:serine/threonine protein phosphatase PrpC
MAGAHGGTFESTAGPAFSWGATTHVGGVRSHNEDAFYASDDVCVVADGMGGHEAGEVASQLVTQLASEVFSAHRLDVTELPRFVSTLNAAVFGKGVENNTRGMGTTLVGVAVADNGDAPSAVVFHVGDSRCYRLAGGAMTQLTTDHSHVQNLVQEGRITPAEALTHPLRNVITRALGADVAVEADFHVLPDEDCRLLLCSDGLSGEIDDDRIGELLATHVDPSKAAVALVEAVLDGPARDNVTAIVLDLVFPVADPTDELRGTDLHPVGTDGVSTNADVTAEVEMLDARWAPPAHDSRTTSDAGRPSAPPDAAAWGAPNPPSTDPTPQ